LDTLNSVSRAQKLSVVLAVLGCCGCGPSGLYTRAVTERDSGDLTRSIADATKGYEQWQSKPGSHWHWRFKLLLAELLSIRDTRRSLVLLQDDIPPQVEQREYLEIRLLTGRGSQLARTGKLRDAANLLDHAAGQARRAAPVLVPEILLRRAAVFKSENNVAQAEAYTHEAISLAQKSGDRYSEANGFGQLGFILQGRSRFDEAISMFSRSFAISKTAGYEAISELTAVNLGWCYFRLGDLDRAAAYYREGEISNKRTTNQRSLRLLLNNLGSLHSVRGETREAIAAYQRALAISEKFQDPAWTARNLDNLATATVAAGDLDTAEGLVARSLELKSKDEDVNSRIWPLLAAGEICYERRDYAAAKATFGRILAQATDAELLWAAHAGLAQTHAAEGDIAGARAAYASAIGVIDASWTKLLNDTSKLTFPTGVARFYHQYVDFLMSRGLEREALEFAESRRARLLSEGAERSEAPANFSSVAKRLDAVLLSYWLSPARSYLWVVGPDQMRAVTLPAEPKLRSLVMQYRKAIDANRGTLTADPTARELYDILLAPAAGLLKPNGRVVLVPDGILHSLNFETLVAPSGRYWLEDATVEIAPSLRLIGREDAGAGKALDSILLIGDPIYTDPGLPPLPHAAEEIRGIAPLFPKPLVLTGAAAQPAAYRASSPGRFGMIHFAAHALANSESPLDSAVALSPGPDTYKLYAREVQATPLDAELVTVSACRSAGERTYSGEGLVGFAWAFLRAGAKNVIASLWDVNDNSTAAFMKSLYTKVRDGQRPAAALRAVKLEFLRGSAWQKPYYWAPFQVYAR
jgi:CHAT domain-containing protein/Tfp pilus assembly protein PilF